jgi:hypothetical protein
MPMTYTTIMKAPSEVVGVKKQTNILVVLVEVSVYALTDGAYEGEVSPLVALHRVVDNLKVAVAVVDSEGRHMSSEQSNSIDKREERGDQVAQGFAGSVTTELGAVKK